MGNLLVKHKKGYNPCSCDCKTYICHWENYAGEKANKCYKKGCSNAVDLDGAHVYKCSNILLRTHQYIVPLCSACNTDGNVDCFELIADAVLVPVGSRDNCKKCD